MTADLVRAIIKSSLVRYTAEAVLVGAAAIACVVIGALHHQVPAGLGLGAVFAMFALLAARPARSLLPFDDCRVYRELVTPSGGRDAIGWAYLVRRGGPIGPWAGCVQLRFLDGGRLRLHTSAANAEQLLQAIAELPDVLVGYTADAERAYKQRRA